MARRTPISLIQLPGWVKGLNRDADPYQLEVVESPDALNVDFGVRGAVTKRRGYTAFDESMSGGSYSAAIAASGDDYYHDSSSFASNLTRVYVGSFGASNTVHAGFRFDGITIPNGAVITSAVIDFRTMTTITGTASGSVHTKISAVDEDDPAAATDTTSCATDDAARTTAQVDWDFDLIDGDDLPLQTADFATVVQEIVDRAGWLSGQAMLFHIDDDGSIDGLHQPLATEDGAFTAPTLTITYDTPLPRAMTTWKTTGGSERMFYVSADGTILQGTGTPLVDSTKDVGAAGSTVPEYVVGIASLNDVIYFTALGTTTIPSFDGSTWTDVTATAFAGTAARFPKAAHLATHHDRIFAANVKNAAGTRFTSRVHWSDPLDAETWPAANFIDFDPDDGQEITAMVPFGESLMVFKNHSVQLLTGRSEDSFTRYDIESQVGTEAPGSVVAYSGVLYFFDPSTGVWSFDGAAFSPEDEALNRYLIDGISFSNRYKTHAFIWKSRYWLCVPWGTDSYPSRTFVKDLRTGAWTEYDFGVHASTVFDNKQYGGGPRNTAGIYQLDSGLTDDGTAIASHFRTAWLAPEDIPAVKHRLRRLDTIWDAIGDIDVTLNMFRDFNNVDTLYTQDIDTDPGGALYGFAVFGVDRYGAGADEVFSRTTGWGNARWRVIQLEAKTIGATDDFQLNRMSLVVSSLSRARGED